MAVTWLEFKRRAEELGVEDDDEIGIVAIDDEGFATFDQTGFMRVQLAGPMALLPDKSLKR